MLTERQIAFMQWNAQINAKPVPTVEELRAIDRDTCEVCKEPFDAKQSKRQATLQHWEDGRYGLLCRSCNSRHGNLRYPQDVYLHPQGLRRCHVCETVKPLDDYYRTARRLDASCKPCSLQATRQWKRKNAERNRQHARDYQARKRATMNPDALRTLRREQKRAERAAKR